MWDNTASKRNPKAPDFRCKNQSCGKAVWLKQGQGAPSNGNGNHAPAPTHHAPSNGNGGGRPLGPLYAECLDFATKACEHYFPGSYEPADAIAAAATLFIQAVRDGAPIRAAKVEAAPPPPPPPPVQRYESASMSDLPF